MEIELKHGSKIALAAIPLAQILAKAASSKSTVVVSLKKSNITKNIFIKEGSLVFANSNDASDHVKNMLLEEKKLAQTQIAPVQEHMAANKSKFLDSLVALGYFPKDKLDDLKARHASLIITNAHNFRDGFAEIVENKAVFSKITCYDLNIFKIVAEGIKLSMPKESVTQALSDLVPANFMIITEKGEEDAIINKIPPEVKGLITIIESSPNIKEAVSSSFLSEEDVYKYLYYLVIFGLAKIETPDSRQARLLEKSLSDEDKKKKLGVLSSLENFKNKNYYEILAVLEDAPQKELDEAKNSLFEKYNPAKFKNLFWGEDKDIPDKLASKIEEAYNVLSDEKKRSEYDKFVARGEADKFAEKSTVIGSGQALETAKGYLAKKDYLSAIKHLEAALKHTPEDTDIMCALAMAIFQNGGAGNTKAVNESSRLLKKAHSIDSKNYRIFLEFAKIFKALGKESHSLDSYKKALYLNPFCKEAEDAAKEKDKEGTEAFRIKGLSSSLNKFNYYQLLDIKVDASSGEIKKAYYKATKKYHPDKHFTKDSEELKGMTNKIYKRIVEAYMVLKNATKRKEYDDQLGEYKPEKEIRLKDAADVVQKKEKQEIVFESKNAKKFFELGLTSLAQKKLNAAKMNFQFALQAEPNNIHIKRKLKEVEDLEKGS